MKYLNGYFERLSPWLSYIRIFQIFSVVDYYIYWSFLLSLCTPALTIEEAKREDPGTNIEYFDEWHGEKGAPLVSGDPTPSITLTNFTSPAHFSRSHLWFASFREKSTESTPRIRSLTRELGRSTIRASCCVPPARQAHRGEHPIARALSDALVAAPRGGARPCTRARIHSRRVSREGSSTGRTASHHRPSSPSAIAENYPEKELPIIPEKSRRHQPSPAIADQQSPIAAGRHLRRCRRRKFSLRGAQSARAARRKPRRWS